ncbi:integrase catalytic domain-containing protein [Trichonephila clavipes]|nr:integrase catalytic domain-containing protein [Trichonephila clavipes]
MGNLPSESVNISSPFTVAGLDLCGPFLVKYKNQRKRTLKKVYICVCICYPKKGIHLDLLSDLTSDALIAMLKRFTSRRGKCSEIYTDKATNFVEANSILKKFHKLIIFPDEIVAKYFVSENIDWKFIPPKSPNFGGLWVAGVKSVKHHLKRAIGNLHFTFEKFETIMIQVEGILNSRPLTPLSSHADNFDVLTPAHFLIERPITSIPEPNLIDINENVLNRWEKITKLSGPLGERNSKFEKCCRKREYRKLNSVITIYTSASARGILQEWGYPYAAVREHIENEIQLSPFIPQLVLVQFYKSGDILITIYTSASARGILQEWGYPYAAVREHIENEIQLSPFTSASARAILQEWGYPYAALSPFTSASARAILQEWGYPYAAVREHIENEIQLSPFIPQLVLVQFYKSEDMPSARAILQEWGYPYAAVRDHIENEIQLSPFTSASARAILQEWGYPYAAVRENIENEIQLSPFIPQLVLVEFYKIGDIRMLPYHHLPQLVIVKFYKSEDAYAAVREHIENEIQLSPFTSARARAILQEWGYPYAAVRDHIENEIQLSPFTSASARAILQEWGYPYAAVREHIENEIQLSPFISASARAILQEWGYPYAAVREHIEKEIQLSPFTSASARAILQEWGYPYAALSPFTSASARGILQEWGYPYAAVRDHIENEIQLSPFTLASARAILQEWGYPYAAVREHIENEIQLSPFTSASARAILQE